MDRQIKINMIPGYSVPPILRLSQFDKGYTVDATVYDGAEEYTIPTGYTAKVEGRKTDGTGYQYDATFSGSVVTFTVMEQMTVVYGLSFAEVVFYANGIRVGSANFNMCIEPAPLNEDISQSATDIPLIQQAITAGQNAQRYAYEAQESLNQFETVVAEQVEQMQIKEGQTVIDATLTVSGAAADAKTVGDALKECDEKAPLITDTTLPITTAASDIPMQSCVVNIEPVQSGSGDPSPSNVRAISGWDSVNVKRCGKNLMPNMVGQASSTSNGITWVYNDDGSITINGTATANSYAKAVTGVNTQIYLPKGTYKKPVIQLGTNKIYGVYIQYIKGASSWVQVTGGGISSDTFTIDEDYPLAIRTAVLSGTTVDNIRFEPYIYLDSVTDLTWEPPTSTEYPITLPTTVYGGTLDVVSGELSVTHEIVTFTSDITPIVNKGSAEWTDGSKRLQFNNAIQADIDTAETALNTANYCNCLQPNAIAGAYLYSTSWASSGAYIATSSRYVLMRIPGVATLEDWQAFAANTPVVLVHKLLTPITYTLTPTEIKTLLGANNIIADCGEVQSVVFGADTKLYIDSKIAELQALILEN